MESDINVQVLNVQGSTTRNGKTKYEIALSDGNTYVTFDPNLATKAHGLQGQAVTARVKVEQKGQYTNLYLNDVAPQGQLAPAAPAAGSAIPMAGAPAAGIPMVGGGGRGMDPAREAKIVKQNVLGTAHAFVGSLFQGAGPEALEEAKQLADGLAKELFGKIMGGGAQVVTPSIGAGENVQPEQPILVPDGATAGDVAAAVNEAAGAQVVGAGLPW